MRLPLLNKRAQHTTNGHRPKAQQESIMSLSEKMRKLRERRQKEGGNNNRSNLRDIFFDFEGGDNRIRLVGEFLEVKTHFIAPAPKRSDRGLCQAESFKGDNRIPMVINCPDWDPETEESRGTQNCPICKLNRISKGILDEGPDEEEKDFFKNLASATRQRTVLKWNIIDRNNPFVTKKEGDNEEKIFGFKIASVGMEAYNDIEGIFEQTGMDITDDEEGCDILVTKQKKARWEYSAKVAMAPGKPPTVAMTPLTEEEKGAERHRLLDRCGRQTEPQKVVDALHGDLRDLLELNPDEEAAEAPAPTPAPTPEPAPKAKATPAPAPVEQVEEIVGDEEDDDPLAGTQKKS
jgi:hypothetical protein